MKTCIKRGSIPAAVARTLLTLLISAFVPHPAYGQEILPSFAGVQEPDAALVQGTNGNFCGTTYWGGSARLGSVFEMAPNGVLSTLVKFNGGTGNYDNDGFPDLLLTSAYNTSNYIQASADLAARSLVSTITMTNLNGIAPIVDTNTPTSDRRFYCFRWPYHSIYEN